jgi:hypothetical protein
MKKYVLAKQRERDITVDVLPSFEEGVITVIDQLLMDCDILGENCSVEDFASGGTQRQFLEKEYGEEFADLFSELFELRTKFASGEIVECDISNGYNDPIWAISIKSEEDKLSVLAYSNINHNFMWDAVIKEV